MLGAGVDDGVELFAGTVLRPQNGPADGEQLVAGGVSQFLLILDGAVDTAVDLAVEHQLIEIGIEHAGGPLTVSVPAERIAAAGHESGHVEQLTDGEHAAFLRACERLGHVVNVADPRLGVAQKQRVHLVGAVEGGHGVGVALAEQLLGVELGIFFAEGALLQGMYDLIEFQQFKVFLDVHTAPHARFFGSKWVCGPKKRAVAAVIIM